MNYKDEIKRTVNTEIFKHELKKLVELQNLCDVYKGMIKEDLKSDFVVLDKSLRESLGLYQDFYTKDSYLIDLENKLKDLDLKYKELLKQYNKERNKTFWKKLFS